LSQFDELPEGWKWVELSDIAAIKSGLTKGKKRKDTDELKEIPYLRVANVQRGYLNLDEIKLIEATHLEIENFILRKGDILFTEGGDRDKLGRGWIWDEEILGCIHQNHIFRARLYDSDIDPRLISFYSNTHGQKYFLGEGRQTTNLASINLGKLSQLPIPLPPANEQRRIVEKIEALTARSRKAHAALDEIPALLDQFRQSVLAAAFRGDLTADWRAQNPNVEPAEALLEPIRDDLDRRKNPEKVDASKLFDIPEKWSWVSLEAIATHKSGVAFKSKDFIQEGVQVIRLGNVYKGKLDLGRDPVFLPPLCIEGNFNLVPGCIVVSQTGTRFKKDYGNFVLIPNDSPKLLLNQRLLAVYCHPSIDPEYVVFASKLEAYQNHFFASETGGVNQGNVGVSGVMEGPISRKAQLNIKPA
jgi:type I restriction enzyme S subunit